MSHEHIDRRSLEMHRAIAEKLRRHPELMEIAHDNMRRWSVNPACSQYYMDEWNRILQRPLDEILTLILEDSERMTALRHTSPFAGILDPQERWEIFERFKIAR